MPPEASIPFDFHINMVMEVIFFESSIMSNCNYLTMQSFSQGMTG